MRVMTLGLDSGEAPPVPPSVQGAGPGWHLFGHAHPTWKRKKRVEDLEQDIVRAYEDASGETAERERLEAIRELKRTAATALTVAKREDDPQLEDVAQKIIALNRQKLAAQTYLDRVGKILTQLQSRDDDDVEALNMIARLS
jgi:hypothetical protein